MKGGVFILGSFPDPPEHFAGTGKIKTAFGAEFLDSREDKMSSIDIGIHGGKLIFEGIADKALGSQVIDLLGLYLPNDHEDAGIAFH